MAMALREQLIALTEPLLGQLGYELVDLEYAPGAGTRCCGCLSTNRRVWAWMTASTWSQELSALLDVEDPVPMAYTLEVSSPAWIGYCVRASISRASWGSVFGWSCEWRVMDVAATRVDCSGSMRKTLNCL